MPKAIEKRKQTALVRDSAQQIWLAGLGALSLAEDESGKFFNALVQRGKAFDEATRDRIAEVRSRLDVRKAADSAVSRIGDAFDDGMTDMLHRLGVPTKKEIEGLTKRVERLTKTLEQKRARPARRRTNHRARKAVPASAG